MVQTLWLARNEDGRLNLHYYKPELIDGVYTWRFIIPIPLNRFDFPEVTWENSPIEVELKLKLDADTTRK